MSEFYTQLHERLITDVADSYGSLAVKQESKRDCAELRNRVRSEGLSFLTKTLPKLGKVLEKALTQDTLFAPPGLEYRSDSTTPKFLGWLFEQVFSDKGEELSSASPRAIRDLRQILYFSYKLEMPYTDKQEDECLQAFRDTDLGLPDHLADDSVLLHARNFITSVFGVFDPSNILPKHGPGALATGEKNHEKHRFSRLYQAIERVYPFTEYFVYSLDHCCLEPGYIDGLEVLKAGTAKVVLVPKDSRGPRIISCEPLEYQWIQGGLGSAIMRHLESHPLTKGHVNFTRQDVNGRLALSGSKGGHWVTMDMKEASDRVSCALVTNLFRDCPRLLEALMAVRTPDTCLPNGEIVHMKKYAPMGSSLCFPVESIVFFALGVGVIMNEWTLDAQPAAKQVKNFNPYGAKVLRAARRLFIYGDDIIARSEDYALLLQYYPTVGLLFNTDKCCTQGFFRESCGVDAYKGVNVTPLRVKKLWMPGRYQTPTTVMSYVSFCNEAYARGYHRVASLVSEAVENQTGCLPVLPERLVCHPHIFSNSTIPGLSAQYGAYAWIRPYSCTVPRSHAKNYRFGSPKATNDYQRREVRVTQVEPEVISVNSNDWSMVLRRLTTPTKCSDPGVFSLTRRVTLKRVWLAY